MSFLLRKVNPQPISQVVGFFHGTEEYDDDDNRWYYQSPVADGESGLIFNESLPIEDKEQPGRKRERFNGEVIESVKLRLDREDGLYYWAITTIDGTLADQ